MSASLSLVMARSGTSLRWWVDGERTPRLDALLAEPERVLEGPGSLAREAAGRKRFFRVDGGGEPALYVKVFTLPPGAARWRYFLRPSKARRERAVASRIERLGVAVVRPVAVGEERRLGVLTRSFAVRRDARRAAASALQEGRNIAREGAALVVRARAGAKTLRLELAGDDARLCWVRAHQLERLGLPALRPARLDGNRVDLVDPGTALPRAPADQVIARSLAALAPYGRFRAPPQWRFTTHGAVLSNPHAFEFES